MPQVFEINEKLPSRLKEVKPFIRQVLRRILALAIARKEVFILELALEEALTNAKKNHVGYA